MGGKEVNPPGKFPFVINAGLCSAVLVSPNVAIGVAHCCYNKLVVGAHNVSAAEVGREEFEVVETIFATGKTIPYRFVYEQNYYDIVILRLNGFSEFSPIDINDVALPVTNVNDELGSVDMKLLLTGWGSEKRGEVKSDTLKEASLKLIPVIQCRKMYNKRQEGIWEGSRRDLVCASKTVNSKTSGSCTGDDGAPLINTKTGKLVGITTTRFIGVACDNEDYPSVFTNANYYKDWIEE